MKMESEWQALTAFVRKFDSIGLGGAIPSNLPTTKLHPPLPTPGGAAVVFAERQRNRLSALDVAPVPMSMAPLMEAESPVRVTVTMPSEPSLMEEHWDAALDELSFDVIEGKTEAMLRGFEAAERGDKENVPL